MKKKKTQIDTQKVIEGKFLGKHILNDLLLEHSHKKRIVWKHGAELAVLRTYVESQAILEPILL